MNALQQLAALAGDRVAVLKTARESNRESFPAGKYLDVLNEYFPNAHGKQQNRVTFAENEHGETIGKRDDEGFARIHWQGYAK